MIESFQHSNISEEEMGQNHAIDSALNSIAKIQARIPAGKESKEYCIDCDNEIPIARRMAVVGCDRCIICQSIFESKCKS